MTNLLFDTLFNGQPELAPCLRLVDGRDTNYGELQVESARVAKALSALGVQAGDRVAAQIDESVAAVALYLAPFGPARYFFHSTRLIPHARLNIS